MIALAYPFTRQDSLWVPFWTAFVLTSIILALVRWRRSSAGGGSRSKPPISLRTYWRVAGIVGGLWLLTTIGFGVMHMPWPNVDELRAEQLATYCTISPFGNEIRLTQRYSESQLRDMARTPEGIAPVVTELNRGSASRVSPELRKYLSPRDLQPYSSKEQQAEVQKWNSRLQRCVQKLDVDYAAVRRHEAALSFAPRIAAIVRVPLWLLYLGIGIFLYRLVFVRRSA